MDDKQFPAGRLTHIAQRGPRCAVPSLGNLVGLAVVHTRTGEPLQYLSEHSNPRHLLAQWDMRIDEPARVRR